MLSEVLQQLPFSAEKLSYPPLLQGFFGFGVFYCFLPCTVDSLHSHSRSFFSIVYISHSLVCLSDPCSSWVGRSQLMVLSFSNKIQYPQDNYLRQHILSSVLRTPSSTPTHFYVVQGNCECGLCSAWYTRVFQDSLQVNFTHCLAKQQQCEFSMQTLPVCLGLPEARRTGYGGRETKLYLVL